MSKVKINYKSGHSEILEVDEFKVTFGSEMALNWKMAEKSRLRPLFINPAEIESIWEMFSK
mgnify:FL=1